MITIQSTVGRIVTVRLSDPTTPTNKGRPRGSVGAMMFYHVGEDPPSSIAGWQTACLPARTRFRFDFPPGIDPGSKVYLTGCRLGARLQRGPLARPVHTHVGFSQIITSSNNYQAAA